MAGHAWSWGHEHHWMGGGPWARGRRPYGVWQELFGEPAPRADRGGVRYLVLDAIAEQPRHGYEIIQAIEERSGGSYRPSPGVVYPTLQLLEELAHARLLDRDGRKVYAITDEGRQDLERHRDEVDDFYARSGSDAWEDYAEEFGGLMKRMGRIFRVFRRSGRRGHITPATMKRLGQILDEALAHIEETLDEGQGPRRR